MLQDTLLEKYRKRLSKTRRVVLTLASLVICAFVVLPSNVAIFLSLPTIYLAICIYAINTIRFRRIVRLHLKKMEHILTALHQSVIVQKNEIFEIEKTIRSSWQGTSAEVISKANIAKSLVLTAEVQILKALSKYNTSLFLQYNQMSSTLHGVTHKSTDCVGQLILNSHKTQIPNLNLFETLALTENIIDDVNTTIISGDIIQVYSIAA